ncbi:hypothetical protein [Mesorhizobium sp. M1403]|uniref:hypothetical protein n=1 Tax=Mesorhizobium sp. M1403 TaxID=2957097 RepID=UPI00333A10FE
MSEPAHWHDTVGRLRGNEPLRLLIGERLYSSSEIVLAAPFAASLRKGLIADIEAQIAALTPPDPNAPACHALITLPDERTA